MSLRDQLLAKGLVSEKRAKQLDREAKDARKSDQANREAKRVRELAEATAREAEAEAALLARAQARRAAELEREAREHGYRIQQIVEANRVGSKGPQVFFHRRVDGPGIGRLWISELASRELRAGRLAIAGVRKGQGPAEHHVITASAAGRLAELAPAALVHWVTDHEHFGDPAEGLLHRTWESSLKPHRVRS